MRAGRGPAPDVDGAVPLEDSVVAENVGQADIGTSDSAQRQNTKQKDDEADGFHGLPWNGKFRRACAAERFGVSSLQP